MDLLKLISYFQSALGEAYIVPPTNSRLPKPHTNVRLQGEIKLGETSGITLCSIFTSRFCFISFLKKIYLILTVSNKLA